MCSGSRPSTSSTSGRSSAAAARELLASRVAAAGVDGRLRDEPVFTELCERLDGVPLAIELAAPWFRTRSPAELLRLLDSRLAVLAAAPRDAPARHRTMRSAIDWGFDLLDPAAQHLLGRVSLFRRQIHASAAAAASEATAARAEALDALVEASIVQPYAVELRPARGRPRVRAGPAFRGRPGARSARRRTSSSWPRRAEPELVGADQGSVARAARGEPRRPPRVRSTGSPAPGDAGPRASPRNALGRFWYIRGYLSEGLERLQRRGRAGHRSRPGSRRERAAHGLRARRPHAATTHGRASSSSARSTLYRELGDDDRASFAR